MIGAVILALVMALAFCVAWHVHRQRRLWGWAIAWLVYALYEYLMAARVLCTGECNIRVDLLLIFPSLALGTMWVALTVVFRWGRRVGRDSSP